MPRPVANIKPPVVAIKDFCSKHNVTQTELAGFFGTTSVRINRYAQHTILPPEMLWALHGLARMVAPAVGRPQKPDSRRSEKRAVDSMLTFTPIYFLEDGTSVSCFEMEALPGGTRYWSQSQGERCIYTRSHDPKYSDMPSGACFPAFELDAK